MSKAPFLLPTAFVGCPYGKKFNFKAFRKTLERLPIAWYYADTSLKTKHLLDILTTYVKAVDFWVVGYFGYRSKDQTKKDDPADERSPNAHQSQEPVLSEG